ncbi:MAG: ATP-binding protein [Ignavibacteria bacterium]|nr:ATP-binding protein [Ignavibacteria bacterium]
MTSEELESILSGGIETQKHEFKTSIPWNIKNFAKAILSMANLKDGGSIIIGFDDDLKRIGVSEEIKETYKIETMKDQLNSFADPKVDFNVSTITDIDGKESYRDKSF